MRGRQRGKPTKEVSAFVDQRIPLGKAGVKVEVWERWKRGRRKLGTVQVTVFGLRWWVGNGRRARRRTWDAFSEWMLDRD